jgi:hypothetical protein
VNNGVQGPASQVDSLLGELRDARSRAEAIFTGPSSAQLLRRASEKRWSAAECVEHLNISNRAYLPRLKEGLSSLRHKNLTASSVFRLDWNARLLKYWLEPPSRLRLPTGTSFEPITVQDPSAVLSAFHSLGQTLEEELSSGKGLALDAAKISSPFAQHMRYNVYSAFVLIAAHNRRHLWQAENAL